MHPCWHMAELCKMYLATYSHPKRKLVCNKYQFEKFIRYLLTIDSNEVFYGHGEEKNTLL
jgi:hypothetical protein